MKTVKRYVDELVGAARDARRPLASASTAKKNEALLSCADAMLARADELAGANAADIAAARKARLGNAFLDRLTLSEARIRGLAEGLRTVGALPDPVGRVLWGTRRPNGLSIRKVSVPIGVIFMIYESRPNVTAEAAGLCLKSGNPVILRTGREALQSSLAIHRLIADTIENAGLPAGSVQLVDTPDRAVVGELLGRDDAIDLVIPRGGKSLIRRVAEESSIPVIKHYEGICHTFVDASADVTMAVEVCMNAKVQRPGVCNAMETLLVHRGIARRFLPRLAKRMVSAGVELRGCPRTRKIVRSVKAATERDWRTEYLAPILSIRVVDSTEQAIEHIETYGSAHSDAIITRDLASAALFERDVDSSAVFVNCSTRFNDGGEFGMGAEIGISTDRLHARGPMGLEELTIYKYVVEGDGQVRS
ncbi:MAG: glutamate-5-semialdehyde dehydrogenase [Planctomycetota bacterium]